MSMKRVLAVAIVAAFPSVASAVPISQLDIVGNVNPSSSDITADGQLDFLGDGSATIASGIFESVITIDEAQGNPLEPTAFGLFDIQFEETGPQLIYAGAGFEFFATTFLDFDNALPGRGFGAVGFITTPSGNLPGEFALSSQATDLGQTRVSFSSTTTVVPLPASAMLLIAAMGGLGLLWYRRRAAAT